MPLPPCHFRENLPHEPGWYTCAHPDVYTNARLVNVAICLSCSYAQPAPASPVGSIVQRRVHSIACVHLGPQTGEQLCMGCGGSVRWKVFRCDHPQHRDTTIRGCQTCGDYQQPVDSAT